MKHPASQQIGGSTPEIEMARISYMGDGVAPIQASEHDERIQRAREKMAQQEIGALVLFPSSNLTYFTGMHGHPSERLTAAIIPLHGDVFWITPQFEEPSLRLKVGDCRIITWQEEDDPFEALALAMRHIESAIAVDEDAPYWAADRLARAFSPRPILPATKITSACRRQKSPAEIAIIKHVMTLTLEVHRAAARILRAGITAKEVEDFINEAHRRIAGSPSTFCIVSFGEATAYPHGGPAHQVLEPNDMVLIDTGTSLHGYKSDITRSYVFGNPSERQRAVWNAEKDAQLAAFAAARIGEPCEAVDHAARVSLAEKGFGPDYEIPGLPHRTGHGLGLDLHEHPYLVRGNREPLAPGMCFSNEPMLCLYGEFGVRLEDHFYMTENGPRWFTDPAVAIDHPFP